MEEKSKLADIDLDFWFLKKNGVHILTAIYIVGEAYKEDIVIMGVPKMQKKVYICYKCGKSLIRRHLPYKWSIRTTKSNNKIGYKISYVCDDCKRKYKEKTWEE